MSRSLFVFYGHHKTATRWVGGVLERLAEHAGLRYAAVSNPKWFDYDLSRFVAANSIDVLNYMNTERLYAGQLRNARGFHLVRDPRDLSVSAYFSHRYSHDTDNWPELVEHRARLTRLNDSEGLLLDMEFTDRLRTDGYDLAPYQSMLEWHYNLESVLERRYESLVENPQLEWRRIAAFLGLPVTPEVVAQAVADNSFERLSGGRFPGTEDQRSHYRKGTPGDWRNYFEPCHRDYFKARYNPLLIKLGYEHDEHW